MAQDKGKLVHSLPANELTEKLFGFESVIAKRKLEEADNTNFFLDSDTVPDGKIWKVTSAITWNADGDVPTYIVVSVVHNDIAVDIHRKMTATAQNVSVAVIGEFYLDVDDYIEANLKGVAVGERCGLSITGYEMNAP